MEYLLAVSLLYDERNARAEQVVERLRSRNRESIEGRFLYGVVKMLKRDYSRSPVESVQLILGEAFQSLQNSRLL